jgi:hypothetical protein
MRKLVTKFGILFSGNFIRLRISENKALRITYKLAKNEAGLSEKVRMMHNEEFCASCSSHYAVRIVIFRYYDWLDMQLQWRGQEMHEEYY